MKVLLSTLAVLMFLTGAAGAGSVGFQRLTVPDSDEKPREIGIWYPTDAIASPQSLGPYRHRELNAAIVMFFKTQLATP